MSDYQVTGPDIKKHVKKLAAREPIAFAFNAGKGGDDGFLAMSKRKGHGVLYKEAKKDGPGNKAASGTCMLEGKVLSLTCENQLPSLAKKLKKFLKDNRVPVNIRVLDSSGAVLEEDIEDLPDDPEDEDAAEVAEAEEPAEEAVEEADEAVEEAEEDTGASARAAQLMDEFKAIMPRLKEHIAAAEDATAEKLKAAAQAFGKEMKSESFDRAEQILSVLKKRAAAAIETAEAVVESAADKVEEAVETVVEKAEEVIEGKEDDPESGLRKSLIGEFNALGDQLTDAMASANRGAAKKVAQLSKMFDETVQGTDLKRAGQVLELLKKTMGDALKTAPLAEEREGAEEALAALKAGWGKFVDSASETLSDVAETLGEAAEDAAYAMGDAVGYLNEEDTAKKAKLEGFDLSEEEMMEIIVASREDPKAVEAALAVLKPMKALNLPKGQSANLRALAASSPKTFEATLDAMTAMDPGGAIDVSPAAMAASLQKVQDAREARQVLVDRWNVENRANKAAIQEVADKQAALDAAAAAQKAAEDALKAFQDALPDDLSTLPAAEQERLARESGPLINAVEDAKKATAAATTAHATAVTAQQGTQATIDATVAEYRTADAKLKAEKEEQKKLDEKRGLLDALSFGPLSSSAKTPLADEDKTKLIEAYAKDPGIGKEAIALAGRSKDPALIAANIGDIVAKFEDGFADKDGNAITATEEEKRAMAMGALEMGATRGQAYFDGFKAYLESGAQAAPDPTGGLSKPERDGKKERERLAEISRKRTAMMAGAAVKDDGTVDFASEDATKAMDHLLYHPGSLTTTTPHSLEQVEGVRKLFTDDATKEKANEVIGKTKAPGAGETFGSRGKSLIAGVMDVDPAAVTDNHAKEAVLSAMMSPLSQGPVGSCFSTAPVRGIRETKPLEAMEAFSDIASTGAFKTKQGDVYPANMTAHAGENPLMRSWEYSVAGAAANLANSSERKKLGKALMDSSSSGKDFTGIESIVGADEWADKNDPDTGDIVPGVKSKLQAAIMTDLKFVYNAAPGPTRGGSGDGHSTAGGYEIHYKRGVLDTEEKFLAAMEKIALKAAGVEAGSNEETEIKALVADPAFKRAVLSAGGSSDYEPWKRKSGGLEMQTVKVIRGGDPQRDTWLSKAAAGNTDDEGDRTKKVLTDFLKKLPALDGEMAVIGTTGKGANHSFNTMPNHPSLDPFKGPDAADKIEELLLKPGKKVAEAPIPADKAGAMFDSAMRPLADSYGGEFPDLMSAALGKRPSAEMTPKALDALIGSATEDFRTTYVERRTAAWKKKQEDAGKTVSAADERKEKAEWTEYIDGRVKKSSDEVMADAFDLPEIVIADTNWGGPTGQTYFVMSPDPTTGKLKMYKKDKFTGKLTPAGEQWVDAAWDRLEE